MAHECPDCDYETDVELDLQEHVTEVHHPMTRDAVLRLVNEAADRVIEQMEWDDMRERDAINLMVNMLGAMLDDPNVTVDEVMENYQGGADEVRSWWPGWGRPTEVSPSA